MHTFQHNGQTFEVRSVDEAGPNLMAALLKECETRNTANPDLLRVNNNTWVPKDSEQRTPR